MFPLRRFIRFSICLCTKPGGRILPGFVLFCLLIPNPAVADPTAVESLVVQARSEKLDQHPYWQTLLHYLPSWRGKHSLIDDPRFFLADEGAIDPEAELAATLTAFFQPVGNDRDEHARCRFPARFDWLDSHLEFSDQLPPLSCPKFEKTESEIEPRSAELIFPGSNFNNPASMFGHTLININGPYKSKLLSHALNYSAYTQEKNGFAYAVKGILGFYKGFYSVLPYYAKLKQYNDLERRDIWEYELNLNAEEMQRMFRHIWELEDIYSDYFFFDENCAYQLLFLFDIARPSLHLVDQARPWVIPVDTIRILEEAGVIISTDYRPSKANRIAWIVAHMSVEEKVLAEQLLHGEAKADAVAEVDMTLAQKIRVLDLATETVEFQYLRQQMERDEYRPRYLSLLQQRSYLKSDQEAVPAMPIPTRPDQGHGSNRVALIGGELADEPFAEFRWRPAYHNLLDADEGYLSGSQIDFGNLVVRHYTDLEKTRLHSLDLVSIVSLAPRHRFYKPVSWKVAAGFERQPFRSGQDYLVFSLNPGGGFTFGHNRSMLYLLAETDLQFSNHYRDNFMLGFGGSGGFLARLGQRLKMKLEVRQIGFLSGDESYRSFRAEAGFNWKLGVNSSLVVEAGRHKEHDVYASEVKGGLNYYW